jgi:hypothetical protein
MIAGPSGTDICIYYTEGIKAQAGRFYSLKGISRIFLSWAVLFFTPISIYKNRRE